MFKAKIFKLGNSQAVYIPKKVLEGYNIGDVITLELGGPEMGEIVHSALKKAVTPGTSVIKGLQDKINDIEQADPTPYQEETLIEEY